MTKEDILALQAQNLAIAEDIQDSREETIAAIPEAAGKLIVTVVPIAYEIIIEPAEGFEEEYNSLIETYGFRNG